jgi:hypothetical protein
LPGFIYASHISDGYQSRCETMILKDAALVGLVNQEFIPIRLDIDEEPEIAGDLGINESPTTIITRPDGSTVRKIQGIQDPEQLNKEVQQTLDQLKSPAHRIAEAELQKLGVHFKKKPLYKVLLEDKRPPKNSGIWLTIDDNWLGGRAKMKYLRDLSNLKEVVFGSGDLNDDWCAELAHCPDLEAVFFLGAVTDRGLAHLAGLHKLQAVSLVGTKITDQGMRFLAGMNSLRWLSLSGTQVSDVGLVYLKNLKNLEVLSLEGTQTTGKGLAHIQGLTRLRHLRLAGATPGPARGPYGLKYLAAMRNLRYLDAADIPVTDQDLLALRNMAHLQTLNLGYSEISDRGLENLENLAELKDLNLEECDITNAGLKHLRRLQNLERLDLSRTSVDDKGLEHLRNLKTLKELVVEGTEVTEKGMKALRRYLPRLE